MLNTKLEHYKDSANSSDFDSGSITEKRENEINKITERFNNNQKYTTSLDKDEVKLLQIIYNSNIPKTSISSYINTLLETKIFQRVKIQSLLTKLISKHIITTDKYRYDTTTNGKEILLSLFDTKD